MFSNWHTIWCIYLYSCLRIKFKKIKKNKKTTKKKNNQTVNLSSSVVILFPLSYHLHSTPLHFSPLLSFLKVVSIRFNDDGIGSFWPVQVKKN
jgi:hypothetical protein